MQIRRSIRVLQVIGTMHFGGAEKVVVKLALGLDGARFKTAVCCTKQFGALTETLLTNQIDVQRAGPNGRVHDFLRPLHLARVVKNLKPDVVHTHGLAALLEVGQLRLLGQAPHWVHTYHFGNYPHMKKRYLVAERYFSRLPDQLVAVSDRQRNAIIHFHRINPARILTVLNGVPVNQFVLDGCTRQAKRAELGIPEDAPVVGCVCVLTEQKGLSHFLDAARAIHDLRPDVRFLIVGGGPLEQSLRNKANEFGLGSAVHFTGWRFDVAELLCALDVFVMSSLWEAMPVALLEAMAARLPIVVTNVGQNACIVEDGVSGVIIEPADASLISSAVLKLLQRPADAARLAEAALGRVHQHFSTDRMIERYESLYAKGVQSRRPGLFSARLSLGSDAITGTASRQDRG